ncbi:hypothetical protein M409DRAFT_70956 [Zasmidium cellare ATCC 36951]|uniref:Zn(2)-C6 fungal-type domain-containing protein n=1 Tax=Zasmidium cellare ATCC 36951 TaxID=1080233 RepID=A0A6A6BXI5_ZASCE|nr:uncharacterized protein M409DRAFT_70956 [Zasmidium cellare ATCC 36951]KAF2159501.1 hypothetical protein M409DRAFT_70956 [Zasmidium cellare ATCC 36951]
MPQEIDHVDEASQQRRAYKACLHCRKRKSRCDLGGQNGPPCQRCRHELRECIIPEERAWPKATSNLATTRRLDAAEMSSTAPAKKPRLEKPSVRESSESGHAPRQTDLVGSVVQTVVTSGKDALGILFQAADSSGEIGPPTDELEDESNEQAHKLPGQCPPIHHKPVALSMISDTAHQTWSASRFVKMGWLVPAEAVTYLDLFFRNMAALSPVDLGAYAGVDGHFELVTKEPLLCCAILMISSRYHILPGAAGVSRSYFIHDRFWHHCQHLVMRLVFGQEKGSSAKTRTLGSIEGLIVMSEWNPRALHFPPETDGWDSDLLLTPSAPRPSAYTQAKSLVDVIEPARRSDRMSWMLLGCALSLAHELDGFEEEDGPEPLPPKISQSARLRGLLYVSINQLAARQGTTSMLAQQQVPFKSESPSMPSSMPSHDAFLQAWTELVKLFKSFSDIAFASKSATRRLLRSGRYTSILQHFQPLLVQWGERYLGSTNIAKQMKDHLFIEQHYTQIYFSSLGMQAECEQVSAEGSFATSGTSGVVDHEHAQQVIASSCALLKRVVQLSETGVLRFAPVRIFIHATTASIFLLKALALGVRNSQLRSALGILDSTVTALGTSVPDDIHLAHTYASLLKTHIWRLRRAFSVSLTGKLISSRMSTPLAPEGMDQESSTSCQPGPSASAPVDNVTMNDFSPSSFSDWFALPFDPTMAPLFPVGDDGQTPLSSAGDNLDFLWNFQAL